MRKTIAMLMLVMLMGCTAKFTIPDEPKYQNMKVYQVEQGICFDHDGARILQNNIMSLKRYADNLRKILEDLKKGE
jgi:hypothetical protein